MAKQEYTFTVEAMAADLRALGLEQGDTVVMHSNASAMGPARQMVKAPDTGMRWVLDAILEVIGREGTLATPTFTKCFKNVSDGPIGEVWNPDTTPSRVGSLTNYVLRQPGRSRSDHPTHPLAAIGGRAEEFCAGHSWRDGASTFDRGGPWGKLVDWDGKILWLGTDMRTHTAVHIVEDWMQLPYMATCVALVEDGGESKEIEVTMSPAGARDFYKQDSKVAKAWEAAGLYTKGKVCKADSQLMSARAFIQWLWDLHIADPAIILNDNPEQEWSVNAIRMNKEHLANFKGEWKTW
jgi:aminoglycoside 3-N-acetyltransferase